MAGGFQTDEVMSEPLQISVSIKNQIRFWALVSKSNEGCWSWVGVKDRKGYGMFYAGANFRAHRYSLIISGVNLPKGMVVDHICRNTSCVNPSHLRVVTPRQNVIENSNSNAAKNHKKTHCKHGHEFSVQNTGISSKGRYCKECNRILQDKKRRQKGIRTASEYNESRRKNTTDYHQILKSKGQTK